MARFKELRIKKGLTQEELITQFNDRYGKRYGASSISMFENNKRIPETQALMDFADFFNVSVDYLLGRTDQPQDTGFQKGMLGNAPLGQKAPNAKENPSYGLSIQGDLVKIDDIDVHLHPKLAEKLKKGIELALYDELEAAKKKKEADKKWTIIQKVLTEDVGINCLRVSKSPDGDTGDFVVFSLYSLSLDDNGDVVSSGAHFYSFDIDSMFKTLIPIINASADKKQQQVDDFIKEHLSFELAEIKDLDYISPNLSMRHVPDKYRERLRKKQREVTLPYTDEKAQ